MQKCTMTIKGKSRKVLDQFEFDNDIRGIRGFVERAGRAGYMPATAIFESTANYWRALYDELERAGIRPVLVNPFTIRIIVQARFKDDRADSEKLADPGRTDMYTESFVPDMRRRDLRELTRTRLGIQHDATKHKNRIHAILAKYPHKQPPRLFSGAGGEWLRMVPVRDIDSMALNVHLSTIDHTSAQAAALEKEICRIAVSDPRAALLMAMPGQDPGRTSLKCLKKRLTDPNGLNQAYHLRPTPADFGADDIWEVRKSGFSSYINHVPAPETLQSMKNRKTGVIRIRWPRWPSVQWRPPPDRQSASRSREALLRVPYCHMRPTL